VADLLVQGNPLKEAGGKIWHGFLVILRSLFLTVWLPV
jgi:hypothetical protein